MFDPWNATFEEAMDEQEKSNCRVGPTAPLFQAAGAQHALRMREEVESGNGFAIMQCVAQCAKHDLVMPNWLVAQFLQRFRAVESGAAMSWDDDLAFGKPHKSGTHKGKPGLRAMQAVQAWNAAREILAMEPSTPIDEAFFERIGDAMDPKVKTTIARKAYANGKAFFHGKPE